MNPFDETDRLLAVVALKKRSAGEQLTRDESRVLKKAERLQEEQRRRQYYKTVPKKHYEELSGRSRKVLLDQADHWGLPLGQETVDLFAVLRRFHDMLAELAKRKISLDETKLRVETQRERLKTEKLRIEVQLRKGNLVDPAQLQEWLGGTTRPLRNGLDRLQRECGPRARELMLECLDELERERPR